MSGTFFYQYILALLLVQLFSGVFGKLLKQLGWSQNLVAGDVHEFILFVTVLHVGQLPLTKKNMKIWHTVS